YFACLHRPTEQRDNYDQTTGVREGRRDRLDQRDDDHRQRKTKDGRPYAYTAYHRDALLRFNIVPARSYGLAVDAWHVPRRDQLLACTSECRTNNRHYPVSDDETREQAQKDVAAGVKPADAPQDVDKQGRQRRHDDRRDQDLDHEGRQVEVQVVRVEARKPTRQVLIPLRRRLTVVGEMQRP